MVYYLGSAYPTLKSQSPVDAKIHSSLNYYARILRLHLCLQSNKTHEKESTDSFVNSQVQAFVFSIQKVTANPLLKELPSQNLEIKTAKQHNARRLDRFSNPFTIPDNQHSFLRCAPQICGPAGSQPCAGDLYDVNPTCLLIQIAPLIRQPARLTRTKLNVGGTATQPCKRRRLPWSINIRSCLLGPLNLTFKIYDIFGIRNHG